MEVLFAVIRHLISTLDGAAAKAEQTNPVLVFESLLVSVVLIILLYLGLRHIYIMRRLEISDRKAMFRAIERLSPSRARSVNGLNLLGWLKNGKRK